MIHRAKDLSTDQKTLIEGLLGRSISENDAISIHAFSGNALPEWLQASRDSAETLGVNCLSADEIDAEIEAARKEQRSRRANNDSRF